MGVFIKSKLVEITNLLKLLIVQYETAENIWRFNKLKRLSKKVMIKTGVKRAVIINEGKNESG